MPKKPMVDWSQFSPVENQDRVGATVDWSQFSPLGQEPEPEQRVETDSGTINGQDDEDSPSVLSQLGKSFYRGALRGAASVNRLLGLGAFDATRQIFIDPAEAEAAKHETEAEGNGLGLKFSKDLAYGIGGVASTVPADIMTGGVTKAALVPRVVEGAAPFIRAIPDFAVGMGIRRGAEEGSPVAGLEGVAEGMAMHKVGELGKGLGLPGRLATQMPAQGALQAGMAAEKIISQDIDAALQGKPITHEMLQDQGKQILYEGAQGAAMGGAFAVVPEKMGVERSREALPEAEVEARRGEEAPVEELDIGPEDIDWEQFRPADGPKALPAGQEFELSNPILAEARVMRPQLPEGENQGMAALPAGQGFEMVPDSQRRDLPVPSQAMPMGQDGGAARYEMANLPYEAERAAPLQAVDDSLRTDVGATAEAADMDKRVRGVASFLEQQARVGQPALTGEQGFEFLPDVDRSNSRAPSTAIPMREDVGSAKGPMADDISALQREAEMIGQEVAQASTEATKQEAMKRYSAVANALREKQALPQEQGGGPAPEQRRTAPVVEAPSVSNPGSPGEEGAAEAVSQPQVLGPQAQVAPVVEPTPQALPQETPGYIGLKLGERIGGSRKDVASPTGPRRERIKQEDEAPAWRKRYMAMEKVDGSGWVLVDNKTGRTLLRTPFATLEEADRALPLAVVAQKHRVRMAKDGTFDIVRQVTDHKRAIIKSGFETEHDAQRYMVEHAPEIVETKTSLGEEILPKPERVFRTGELRRTGNVQPKDFIEKFGFRGAEFGEWNNQGERQEVLNHAYDALEDLADTLGMPPKALSLNGDLGIAFGARGHGLSGAKAHYERDYGVINLTKMSGAGALAHEWFHSLDHYLGRQDSKASSSKIQNKRGDTVFDAKSPEKDYASHGFSYKSNVRDELRQAYRNLIRDLYSKAEKYVEDTQQSEKFLGQSRDRLREQLDKIRANLTKEQDWGRSRRAASSDELAAFDALADKLVNGEDINLETRQNLTAAGKSRSRFGSWRDSNDTIDGLEAIYKAVRGRSGFTSEREGPFNVIAGMLRNYKKRSTLLEDARAGNEKSKRIITSYLMESRKIDERRATDYWSAAHEMAARAFAAYVDDKIAAQGGRSDFLTYGANNDMPGFRLLGIRPYPEGEERIALREAFDKFFQTIKTEETGKGTMLYARRDEPPRFFRGNPQAPRSPISRLAVEKVAQDFARELDKSPRINVINSLRDLPEKYRNEVPMDFLDDKTIQGVWFPGSKDVFLVNGAFSTRGRVQEVLRHEIFGHLGIYETLGSRLEKTMWQAAKSYRNDKRLLEIADRYGLELDRPGDLILAAKEFIAYLAETDPKHSLVRNVVAAVRDALRRMGLVQGVTDNDIIYWLSRSRRTIEGRSRAEGQASSSFQPAYAKQELYNDDRSLKVTINQPGEVPKDILKDRKKLREYLGGLTPQEVKALKGKDPGEYLAILKSMVRKLFPKGADIQFRKDGQKVDYDHFLVDTTRQDYIHTLPETLKNEDIRVEFKDGDREKAYLIKKYFDPAIQKDIWDLVVMHDGEIRSKFARKGKDGQRYMEGQIMRPDHAASRSGTPAGGTEDASTPTELPEGNISIPEGRNKPHFARSGEGNQDEASSRELSQIHAVERVGGRNLARGTASERIDGNVEIVWQDGRREIVDSLDAARRRFSEDGYIYTKPKAIAGGAAAGFPNLRLVAKAKEDESLSDYQQQNISFTPLGADWSREGVKRGLDDLYRKVIMREYPVVALAKQAGRDVADGIEQQIRRMRGLGGVAEEMLTGRGVLKYGQDRHETEYVSGSKSLKDILSGLRSKEEYRDYETMRVNEREIALEGRNRRARARIEEIDRELTDVRKDLGRESESKRYRELKRLSQALKAEKSDLEGGMVQHLNEAAARAELTRLEAKYGPVGMARLREVSSEHREWERQAILRPMVDAGWMSEKAYKDMISKPDAQYYASFAREMDELGANSPIGARGVVKEIKGSLRKRIPSTEASIANLTRAIRLVEQLRLNKAVVGLRDLTPDLAEQIKQVHGEGGYQPKGTIVVAEGGKKSYFKVPADVQRVLDTTGPKEMNIIVKMLSIPARTLRAGATLSAEFIARNPVRDQFSAYVYSKYGYNPLIDLPKGIFHMMAKDDLYHEFKASGADQSFFSSLDREATHLSAKDITGYRSSGRDYLTVLNPLEALRKVSEITEMGTRLGAYGKAKEKGATAFQAASEAREATLDFGRIGEQTRALNQIIAFWNANVQGTDKLARSLFNRQTIGKTLLRAGLGITLPSLALWAINHDDSRYRELPDWQKNFFWIVIPPAMFDKPVLDADGRQKIGPDGKPLVKHPPIIRIPKPFELGLLFGSLPERILDYAYTKDKKAVGQIIKDIGGALTPGVLPTAALPWLEAQANYSFFQGRPLEDKSMERLPEAMRFNQFTSEPAKRLGKLTDISPVKIDNWVRGWTGTLGGTALDVANKTMRDVPQPAKNWWEIAPVVKGFVSSEPVGSKSASVDRFFDLSQKILQAEAGYRVLEKAKAPDSELKAYREENGDYLGFGEVARDSLEILSGLRHDKEAAIIDKKMSPAEKRQKADEDDMKMTVLSQRFLKRYAERIAKKRGR